MAFDSFADFLSMNGHGVYVWSAYGITLLVLAGNLLYPLFARRRFLQEESLQRPPEKSSAKTASEGEEQACK